MRAGRRACWWNNEEAILLHQRAEVQKVAKKPPTRFLTVNVRGYIWQITFRNEQEENKSKQTVCLFSQAICLKGFCPIYTSGPPQALSDLMSVALRDWSRVCQCQWRPPWQQITLTGFLLLPLIAPQPGTVQTPWWGVSEECAWFCVCFGVISKLFTCLNRALYVALTSRKILLMFCVSIIGAWIENGGKDEECVMRQFRNLAT